MGHNFRDRKHKILAIEPNAASRTLITELLKDKGFTNFQAVPSIREAIAVLENEPVSWILSSIFAEQEANLFQLLNLLGRTPKLFEVRVSAFVEDNELPLLPSAFELGLLSYHMKPFTKDKLQSEFDNLLSDFESMGWKSLPLASSYLRKCLGGNGNYQELLNFERQLMNGQPGNLQQMLNLALPLIKTNKVEEAKSVLAQIQKLDPSLEKQVKQIVATHLNNADLSAVKGSLNILNLKSAVIVDSDTAIQKELSSALQEMGVEKIQVFSDGKSAYEFLKENAENDLIIHEWKIPQLTGPVFLQKAKDEAAQAAPFMLYSSLIEQTDAAFMREMGVACVMIKPTSRAEIIKNIIWTVQQERSPTERKSLERKFRQAIEKRDLIEAKSIMQRCVNELQINVGARYLMEAEIAYAEGEYEKAREVAFNSLKNSGDSIFLLNLLGKIMLQLRDMETALKCFEKARELAPQNLSRLCQIAEIQADLGKTEESDALLESVSELDPDSEKLKESKAKIAINSGDGDAKQLMGQLKDAVHVVSYMNNLAVAMARTGKFEDGISQYKKTMESIPDTRVDLNATVRYNLALAYLRANDMASARDTLTELMTLESKFKVKSAAILKRIKVAEEQGAPFQFTKETAAPVSLEVSETEAKSTAADKHQEVASAITSRFGDRCCFMVYQAAEQPESVKKMLESALRFKTRTAITKGDIAS